MWDVMFVDTRKFGHCNNAMQVVGKTTEGDIVFCEGDGFFLPIFPLNIPSGETDVRAFYKKSSQLSMSKKFKQLSKG